MILARYVLLSVVIIVVCFCILFHETLSGLWELKYGTWEADTYFIIESYICFKRCGAKAVL